MATTIKNATLTTTVSESIVLNGVEQGATSVKSITGINEVFKRIVSITTTEANIFTFHPTTVGAGEFKIGNVRYIRITNLDDTNHVVLTFQGDSTHEFAVKLDYGQSFIYNGDLATGVADTFDADDAALTVALEDLRTVTAAADTAACDLELFVASV